jgi:hypothetical protein
VKNELRLPCELMPGLGHSPGKCVFLTENDCGIFLKDIDYEH